MSISQYIKEIGRGKDGARALSREQAADLMGQVLDGTVTDLEVGAFCLAMRIKGETPDEMAGFLDATHARLQHLQHPSQQHTLHNPPGNHTPAVVLPSYNGARKLPVLTPLLALLLAREGLAVLVHGCETENNRVSAQKVLSALSVHALDATRVLTPGQVHFCRTERLHPGLRRLLDVRRVVGLRNPAHSLVKLMVPVTGPAVLVSSYTHPEYLHAMTATLGLMHTPALLLRGTEGEPVADARRTPAMDAFLNGRVTRVQDAQIGPLTQLPDLPDTSPSATADWISQVMAGALPIPTPIAMQVAHITALARASAAQPSPLTTQPTPQPA